MLTTARDSNYTIHVNTARLRKPWTHSWGCPGVLVHGGIPIVFITIHGVMTQFVNVSFFCVPVHGDTTPLLFTVLLCSIGLLLGTHCIPKVFLGFKVSSFLFYRSHFIQVENFDKKKSVFLPHTNPTRQVLEMFSLWVWGKKNILSPLLIWPTHRHSSASW